MDTETHNICNNHLAKEGGKGKCCDCDPHENCNLNSMELKITTLKEEFEFWWKIHAAGHPSYQETEDWWLAKLDTRLTEIVGEVGKEKKIVHFMSDPDWKLNEGLDKAIEIINRFKQNQELIK